MALDIFRIADDVEMTTKLLAKYIQKNKTITMNRYKKLSDAYENDYEIFHQTPKAKWKPDIRCAVNFAQYIVDTFEGFFMGIPVTIDSPDEKIRDYLTYINTYDDIDDHNAELSKIVSIYGRGYELYYTDQDANVCTAYLNPMESFMIYDEGINPTPRYFVRYYVDSNNVMRGSISDANTVQYFAYNPSLKWTSEPEAHNFDGVPATEYVLNSNRKGIFEGVLNLINVYNHTLSEKANDVDYFSDAYLKVLGAEIDEKTINQMRDNRVINFSGKSATDLIVDFLQKPNGDTTQENLLNRLEKLIFTVAMVVNISDDESFVTSSGIALKYRLLPMINLAKVKERKFKSGLIHRYKMMFSNPVSGMAHDDFVKIDYTFHQNLPVDIMDEADTANKLSGITSKRTQLRLISEISDVDAELEQIKREQDDTSYETDYPTNRTVNQVGD